jgi:hypothetical protein
MAFNFCTTKSRRKLMNILPLVKSVAGLATSLGAGAVVGNAIKASTPAGLKTSQKILVGIGSVALSSVAGEVTAKYIENQIQNVVDGWRAGAKIGKTAAENDISAKEAADAAAFKAAKETRYPGESDQF